MGIHRGSNIIRSGLEFAFDTGYTSVLSNKDSYIYNQGEPTTNLNVDTYHSTRSDGDTLTSATWGGDSGEAEFRTNTSPDGGGLMYINKNTSSPAGSGGVYNDFPATRYTLTNGVTYTRSWWCKSNINQTLSGHICSCNRDSDNTYIIGSNISLTTEWQKFSSTFTYTGPTSTDWQFRHINYNASEVSIANVQLEAKEHATPFTSGSRSNTTSLLDITGQHTLDVSNVSFDSAAHIDFDGTDDYLSLGNDTTFKSSGGWTVESIVKYDSVAGGYNNATSPANFIGSDTISYNSWYWSVLSGKLALWNISPGVWKYGSTTLAADTWYHTVLVSNANGTSYQMYLNGVAEGGDHASYSWNASYSGLKVKYIGKGNANVRRVNGKIPITRIYNRALSSEEIAQNFNAYRGRFNM